MNRRTFLGLGLAALPSVALGQSSSAIGWIIDLLSQASSGHAICGQEDAAVRGTLERLKGVDLPSNGKVLVVNIPSGVVTAYTDGIPVIETKAVVGKVETPTPEMITHVTYVRPNPTWTVPESILRRKDWRQKLSDDPSYFEENGFDLVLGGQTVSPQEAAPNAHDVASFVQRPSPTNALGLLKIGLHDSNAIYIHDTNEPSRFEQDMRAATAGCVRLEDIREVGAWVLDLSREEIDALISAGDMSNHTSGSPVKVIMGYWTAWPDASGTLRYYPDIYGYDGAGNDCTSVQSLRRTAEEQYGSAWSPDNALGRTVWREYTGQ